MPIWSSSQLHRMAARRMGGAEALRHRVAAAEGIDPVLADDLERQAAVDVARVSGRPPPSTWTRPSSGPRRARNVSRGC